jgi:cell division protein FtsI/penicillin-binding protein 2
VNATKGQTGIITFDHAYTWSLNTGMVTIAERMGNGSINSKARGVMYDYFHNRFHLGQKTGIELANEQPGIIEKPDTGDGDAVRYSNMSFGQGLDLNMVQVSSAFCSVINGGNYYYPTVIAGQVNQAGEFMAAQPKAPEKNVISASASTQVRDMAVRARNTFYAKHDKPGYMIGGKTGTSQAIINGEYSFDQTTGTYLGFGGDSKPRYVIMVRVWRPNIAVEAQTVIPIFTDISNWMIDYLKLEPKG